jgi:hypothetical protein
MIAEKQFGGVRYFVNGEKIRDREDMRMVTSSFQSRVAQLFEEALTEAIVRDQEAKDLVETYWSELESDLRVAFAAAVEKVLTRVRHSVKLTIESAKKLEKPDWIKQITKDVPVEPGTYVFTYEEFLREGEINIGTNEMMRRANESGAVSGVGHALSLLENQGLIPKELRGKYLAFAGVEAVDFNDSLYAPFVYWNGDAWILDWYWFGVNFSRDGLLVRTSKV